MFLAQVMVFMVICSVHCTISLRMWIIAHRINVNCLQSELLVVATPFTMKVDLVEPVGTYGVLLNVTLSDTGSVCCVVAPSNSSVESFADWIVTGSIAYYKANVPSVYLFLVTFLPNIEQRLFCLGQSIRNGPNNEATYVSEPFYVSCKLVHVL